MASSRGISALVVGGGGRLLALKRNTEEAAATTIVSGSISRAARPTGLTTPWTAAGEVEAGSSPPHEGDRQQQHQPPLQYQQGPQQPQQKEGALLHQYELSADHLSVIIMGASSSHGQWEGL